MLHTLHNGDGLELSPGSEPSALEQMGLSRGQIQAALDVGWCAVRGAQSDHSCGIVARK